VTLRDFVNFSFLVQKPVIMCLGFLPPSPIRILPNEHLCCFLLGHSFFIPPRPFSLDGRPARWNTVVRVPHCLEDGGIRQGCCRFWKNATPQLHLFLFLSFSLMVSEPPGVGALTIPHVPLSPNFFFFYLPWEKCPPLLFFSVGRLGGFRFSSRLWLLVPGWRGHVLAKTLNRISGPPPLFLFI